MMEDERRKDTAVQEKRLFILTFLNFFRIETKRRRRPSSSTSPPSPQLGGPLPKQEPKERDRNDSMI